MGHINLLKTTVTSWGSVWVVKSVPWMTGLHFILHLDVWHKVKVGLFETKFKMFIKFG